MAHQKGSKKDAARAERRRSKGGARAPQKATRLVPAADLPPKTKGELWRWLKEHAWISVPEGAPLDYLAHAFFEGRERWPGPEGPVRMSRPRRMRKRKASLPIALPQVGPQVGDAATVGEAEQRAGDGVVWACRGGGKTFLAAVATALDLKFKPGIEVRLLAGSLEQGQRMYEHLRRVLALQAFAGCVSRVTSREVRTRHGSRAALLSQSEASVRGTRVQKIRCDEVELFTPEVWEAVQLATRSKDCGGVPVDGAVEALSTMHRAYGLMSRIVEEAKAGRRKLFRWDVSEVLDACPEHRECQGAAGPCALLAECGGRAKAFGEPGNERRRGFMPVADAITMKGRVDLNVWDAEMRCLRVSRADRVLTEFDEAVHVVEEKPPQGAAIVGGMDFGFRAPTVVLWASVDREGRVLVLDERVKAEEVLDEHIAAIRDSKWKLSWIGVDPSGLRRSGHSGLSDVEALKKAGLKVRRREVQVLPGLMLLRGRLRAADGGPPRLRIHARCQNLIAAMARYHYNPGDVRDNDPVKDGPDHAVDALRYLIVNLEGGEVKVGRYA